MKKLKKIFGFLFSFGVARGGQFAAPILLANLLPVVDYARLEFVQAVASMGATLLGLGSASIVPLILLRNKTNFSLKQVYFHQIFCALLLFLVAILLILNGVFQFWLVAPGISIIMLQGLWSVTLKSHGKGEKALFLDLGFWGVLAASAVFASAFSVELAERWRWIVIAMALYWATLVFWTLRNYFPNPSQVSGSLYLKNIRTGVPLMIGTLLSFLALTSGRAGAGLLATPELAAAYAVLFRATALPMVAHQVMTVAMFRQIFQLPLPMLEKKNSVIILLVSLFSILFWLVVDYIGFLLGPAFVKMYASYRQEGMLILAQSIIWSAVAQNEMLNNRAQTAKNLMLPALLYFVFSFSAVWVFFQNNSFSLFRFVCAHSALVVGFFFVQVLVMWFKKVRVYKSWSIAIACYLSLVFLTQFI